jgi:hypothetical protein
MGDGTLLEEAIFRNCQFLQVGRTETVKLVGHVQRIDTYRDSEKFPGRKSSLAQASFRGGRSLRLPSNQKEYAAFASTSRSFSQLFVALQQ